VRPTLPQVNPDIKRDKWEPEEDALLLDLVKSYGVRGS
jgi:hypothetical protein